jgi:two-component system, NarL family, sensor kinase
MKPLIKLSEWKWVTGLILFILLGLFFEIYSGNELRIVYFISFAGLSVYTVIRYQPPRSIIEKNTDEENISKENVLKIEEERNRIARELHDGIQQKLAGISMLMNARMNNENHDWMSLLNKYVCECIEEIRSISHNMKIDDLENNDLSTLLQKFSADFAKQSGLAISYEYNISSSIPTWKKINLYRITQELLTNSLKHSQGHHVSIRIEGDNEQLRYYYADDGVGISKVATEGMGMKNIRKRTEMMNGKMKLPFALGFAIEITIPVEK